MSDLILTTFDWVPDVARGFVRDLRVRWALEEAGLAYSVTSTSFQTRDNGHLAHQPFAQVPWLTHGELSIAESGAILLYLGEQSERLMPKDRPGRSEVTQWVFAALNSVEAAVLPWSILKFSGDEAQTPGAAQLNAFLDGRLTHMECVLSERHWLSNAFSIADILMADVLRLVDRFDALGPYPACAAYVARATSRPAFEQAYADQIAHFAKAD